MKAKKLTPLESTAECLGLLIGKNCVFTAQMKRIIDRIKSITINVKRNFINRSPEIMIRVFNAYILSRIDYCSAVWHPGTESAEKHLERVVDSFWKAGSRGRPPENFMRPRLRMIQTDVILIHKMYHGLSTLEFREIFKENPPKLKTLHDLSQVRNNKLSIPKWRLKIARNRFSFRTRAYWNQIPDEIKSLSVPRFKTHVKKYIMDNAQKFLNMGTDYNVVGEDLIALGLNLAMKKKEKIRKNRKKKKLEKKIKGRFSDNKQKTSEKLKEKDRSDNAPTIIVLVNPQNIVFQGFETNSDLPYRSLSASMAKIMSEKRNKISKIEN